MVPILEMELNVYTKAEYALKNNGLTAIKPDQMLNLQKNQNQNVMYQHWKILLAPTIDLE